MDEIEAIKQAVREFVQGIVARGQPLTPELRNAFQQVLQHAESRITELQGQQGLPQGVENLWVLAGGHPSAFRQYLQNFPDEAINRLVKEPVRLDNIQRQLERRITLPAGEQIAGMPKAPINSSNVYGFSYNPSKNLLRVRFQGGGIYEYTGVPPAVFKIFQRGAIPARTSGQNKYGRWWVGKKPSLGATFFNLIRDRFPYQRVA